MKNLFKKVGIVIMTLSVFTFSSCEELEDLLKFNFDLEGEALYFDVEAINDTEETVALGTETYDRSLTDIIRAEAPNAPIDKIKAIHLTNITLEIVSGADADNNFGNMEKIYSEVKADGVNGSTVAEVLNNPTDNKTKLVIPIKGGKVDVKQYFDKTNFEYKIMAKLRKETTKTLRIKMTADYSFVFGL